MVAYHQTKERQLRPLPDAVVLLRQLHQARVRTGIISAGLRVKQAEKLVRLGVLPWLDPGAIFFSDQMGVSKPNPKIYVKACEALKVPPSRAMYIGDRPETDVAPPRSIGMRTVHYKGAHGRYAVTPGSAPADHEVELLTDLKPILRDQYGLPPLTDEAAGAGHGLDAGPRRAPPRPPAACPAAGRMGVEGRARAVRRVLRASWRPRGPSRARSRTARGRLGYLRAAIPAISTRASLGRRAAWTVIRAGGAAVKKRA